MKRSLLFEGRFLKSNRSFLLIGITEIILYVGKDSFLEIFLE